MKNVRMRLSADGLTAICLKDGGHFFTTRYRAILVARSTSERCRFFELPALPYTSGMVSRPDHSFISPR